jgi:hypothetical protein
LEVRQKALEAQARLASTNAPARLGQTIARLLNEFRGGLVDVVPGRLLMRSRALDADIASFDGGEARNEVADDTLALLLDLATSIADLKSCYPAITRLEAVRLSQHLLTRDVDAALDQMLLIRAAAAEAENVAESAGLALGAGEVEILHTADIISDLHASGTARAAAVEKRAEIAAQMLLDHRNFVASVISTTADLIEKAKAPLLATAKGIGVVSARTAKHFVKKAPDPLSDAAVAVAVGALAGSVLGPTAGLAGFLASYRPLAKKGAVVAQRAKELAAIVRDAQSSTSTNVVKPVTNDSEP